MDINIFIERLKSGKTVRVTRRQYDLLKLEPGIDLKIECKQKRSYRVKQNVFKDKVRINTQVL
jgi:hypothetical protein